MIPRVIPGGRLAFSSYPNYTAVTERMNAEDNPNHIPRRAAQPDDDQPLWAPLIGWVGRIIRPRIIAVGTTADANAEWNPNYTPRRAA